MTAMSLKVGDEVIHPRYGFGTVENLLTQQNDGTAVEYYEIRLADHGVLSVPVARAAALGLRRLVNGVTATLALIGERAEPLPEHPRHRGLELAARWVAPDSSALAGGVRDLLAYARQFGLKGVDQQWLTRACERLGTEAAHVDGITPATARHAITEEVTRLKTPPAEEAPADPKPTSMRTRRRR